jgi:hypothetical protein
MYAGTRLTTQVSGGFEVRDEVARDMAGEMEAASRNAIGSKGFALEAQRVARLMRDRVSLGFIDVSGWDTHVAEGGASGAWPAGSQNWARAWPPSPPRWARNGPTPRSWW